MRLECRIIPPVDLKNNHVQQMFDLMEKNYIGISYDSFLRDLHQKDTLFLFHASSKIFGFTGLKLYPFKFENKDIVIAYSGDTVLDEKYRGTLSIPVYWGIYMLKLSEKYPNLYWLLTSKGFRTYRYLSVFFKDFIPSPNQNNPYLIRLRNQITKEIFPNGYDSSLGILNRGENSQSIRNIEADQIAIEVSKDPYIQYFGKTNPNFDKGHELVCLAHFHSTNINQYILRILNNKSNV
ncbi:hypothetical protein AB3N60_19120 (plasmid) [Leptospira sp. WS39.C2]